ncbi:MAG: hypothetical protein ACKOYH_00960 [Cyanobium sp.]
MTAPDLQTRLASLRDEFATGQKLLADYEARAAAVREQLLRIDGAMQVLTELLGQDAAAAPPPEGLPPEEPPPGAPP